MGVANILRELLKIILGKPQKTETNVTSGRDSVVSKDMFIGRKQVNIQNIYYEVPPEMRKLIEKSEERVDEIVKKSKTSIETPKPRLKSDSEDYKQIVSLLKSERSQESKIRIRSIYHSSADRLAQLQAILVLADWFDASRDALEDIISLCDEGVRLAESLGMKRERAILIAHKGSFLSFKFSLQDMDTAFKIQIEKRINIYSMNELEAKEVSERIQKLDKDSEDCFIEAERTALELNSLEVLAYVYLMVGTAAGIRFNHLNHFGIPRAEFEKQIAKRALMAAKRIYEQMSDEIGAAYALHNMANVLRNFGPEDKEEAKILVKQVIKIAEKHNEQNLLGSANGLLKRIESGKIPKYT